MIHSFALVSHVNEAHKRQKFRCFLCWHSSPKAKKLVGHMRDVHANWKATISPKCMYCSFESTDVVRLERHGRSEHPEVEAFTCFECGFQVFHQSVMAAHSVVHKQT